MTEELVVERLLDSPIGKVYAAWTDPQLMAQWFFPGSDWTAEVEASTQVGGAFRISMCRPDGQVLQSFGTFIELIPPRLIRMSWNSYAVSDTTVTIELERSDSGTHLRLTHSNLPTSDVKERHLGGWGTTLHNLERALAN